MKERQTAKVSPKALNKPIVLNRVEVIDHYHNKGRAFVHWADDSEIKLDYQDGGKTLKIFITQKM